MIIFQPFSHTSMCNQRKGTEALQTDVNNILYVLLSKMEYWYTFTRYTFNVITLRMNSIDLRGAP